MDVLVVRLGGSHASSPLLRPWLRAIEAAAGRIVLVPGGGPFADAARSAQVAMGFDDLAAHRMGLLAMTQYGVALAALGARFTQTDTLAGLDTIIADGRIPVWSPWPLLRDDATIPASWDVTSDSLALWLARAIRAKRALLIKHVTPPRAATTRDLVGDGVLDAAFPDFLDGYKGEVWLAGPDHLPVAIDSTHPPGLLLRAGT